MIPKPAHMVCRTTKLLTRRPGVYVALSTVVRPQPMTSRAHTSNGQSKCAMSRRSILSIFALLAILLELEVRLHHIVDHRRGNRPASAFGVLDQAGDGNLGCLDRRVGDEPRVVALL